MNEPFLTNPRRKKIKVNPLMIVNPRGKKLMRRKSKSKRNPFYPEFSYATPHPIIISKKEKPMRTKKRRAVKSVRRIKRHTRRHIKRHIRRHSKIMKVVKRRTSMARKHRIVGYGRKGHIRISKKSRLVPRSAGRLLNPRGKLLGTDYSIIDVVSLAGGGIAVRLLPNYLPIPEQYKTGIYRVAVQVAMSIALGYVVSNVLKQKKLGGNLMIGGLIASASNLIDAYALKGFMATGDLSVYLPPSRVVSAYLPYRQTVSSFSNVGNVSETYTPEDDEEAI